MTELVGTHEEKWKSRMYFIFLNEYNQHSSLPYQIILYLGGWYFVAYVVAELLVFIFKGLLRYFTSLFH